MTFAPIKVPAAPAPEMARPTMKAGEVGAAALMIEPSSKMTTVEMKTHFAGKKVWRVSQGVSCDEDGGDVGTGRT